ncbi:hypothetical protein DIPPA_29999, partial [Diplonema papillatum]
NPDRNPKLRRTTLLRGSELRENKTPISTSGEGPYCLFISAGNGASEGLGFSIGGCGRLVRKES